ncbi:MAG: glycosyltransferase [Planctomycetota bacterium]
MRICLVSREFAGVRGGGIGTYVAEAANALVAAGHEVWLVTPPPADGERAFDAPGVHIEHVVADDDPGEMLHCAEIYGHADRVHRLLQRLPRFDYIEFADYHAEGCVAIRAQRQLQAYGDTPLVVHLHTPSRECYDHNRQLHRAGEHQREVFALEDEAIREAPHLLCPSAALRDLVVRRLAIPGADVTVQPYPMRQPRPAPLVPPPDLASCEFLFVGRLEPRKGLEALLAAFARLPELSLRIIGRDTDASPFGDSYQQWLAHRCPANVSFVGQLPREQVLAAMASAHVVVLPARFDNFPNTCIEAMALGRVVVGSRHGGMAEMIEHDTSGFLCDPHDPDDLERVLRERVAAALPRFAEIGAAAATRIAALTDPTTYVRRMEQLATRWRNAAPPSIPATPTGSPLVTVVMPFHDDLATIEEAVESALAQDHEPLEVLIVDDGSCTDEAATLLAQLAKRDRRLRIEHKPNGGLSSARNHGIAAARGDFLLMLDADNRLYPNYASRGVTALGRRPDAGFAVPHARFVDALTGSTVGIYNPLPFERTLALRMNRFGDAGAFFRRSTFTSTGLRYDELLRAFEDWALWIDLDRHGIRGCAIPEVLYDYRVRSDSMARTEWWHLSASVGLLIERHFAVDDQAQREQLWALQQTWGDTAFGRANAELQQAHEDHAGTRRHRDALLEQLAAIRPHEDAAQTDAALDQVAALAAELRQAHEDHRGTMRHRDHLQSRVEDMERHIASMTSTLGGRLKAWLRTKITPRTNQGDA